MGRKKLDWYPGAMYHVTARGNRKSDIFKEEIDFELYLKCMKEALIYYKNCYRIISYCLMTNHVHIQIEAKTKPVYFYIGRINTFYAKNFNKKYDFIGHLFQARYNAEIIERDGYFLEVSRYIHLNPLKAKMVEKPEDYKWSSYGMYIGDRKEELITSNKILSYFSNDNKRKRYKEFVDSLGDRHL
ncbi:transposase [Clostridium sp.]|uniref:transposase n=1 Tax=Clostridium sp. TaxID=1506 RepID=UPI003D6CD2B8